MKSGFRAALALSTALTGTGIFAGSALAGAFVNTSQSTVFNGLAFAGFTAPGSTSAATMFLNPATMTGFTRLTIDSNYTLDIPTTKITGTTNVAVGGSSASGDIGQDFLSPATYIVYPVNDRIFVGLSVNAPYGNTTKADPNYQGRVVGVTSRLRTTAVTPSAAYKVTEWFSIGAGVQVQYAVARQYSNIPGVGNVGISGADGFGIGWTLGATIVPFKGTQIGIGWRSFIDQQLNGRTVFGPSLQSVDSRGELNLPNRVNLSIRQTITPQLDILGSAEWQNWARIGNARLFNPPPGQGAALSVLPFNYRDGFFFSIGAEYRATERLTVRAGIGYESTPITDAVRSVTLPDNDRLWLNAGASYQFSDRMTFNASYAYLSIEDAPIRQAAGGGIIFTGVSKADAHLISLGLTSRWGDAPKREEPLVRKF